MSQENSNRRDFVKGASIAAADWTIIRPESARGYPANSRVKVGLLGAGRRGSLQWRCRVKRTRALLGSNPAEG